MVGGENDNSVVPDTLVFKGLNNYPHLVVQLLHQGGVVDPDFLVLLRGSIPVVDTVPRTEVHTAVQLHRFRGHLRLRGYGIGDRLLPHLFQVLRMGVVGTVGPGEAHHHSHGGVFFILINPAGCLDCHEMVHRFFPGELVYYRSLVFVVALKGIGMVLFKTPLP